MERLLIAPIGKLGDHLSEHSIERARGLLVERITNAARERLPTAIAEFDVGGLVRKKVSDYPIAKLEELVLSVAAHHLKTIELFGAIIGFFIGGLPGGLFLAYLQARSVIKDARGEHKPTGNRLFGGWRYLECGGKRARTPL